MKLMIRHNDRINHIHEPKQKQLKDKYNLINNNNQQIKSRSDIISNVPEKHRDHHVRWAQLRQMAVGEHDLHYWLAAEILVEVLRNYHWHGQVLHALDDVARNIDVAQ